MVRRPRCLVIVLLAILLPAPARADVRLVLLSDRDAELSRRLDAEAREIGLALLDAPRPRGESLRATAERERATGVLRVVSSTNVELWVLLRDEGAGTFEIVRRGAESDEAFALRVIEEVRARLVELRLPDADTLGESAWTGSGKDGSMTTPPPGPNREVSSREKSGDLPPGRRVARVAVRGGVGAIFATGGLGASVDAALGLQLRPRAPLRLTAEAMLPLSGVGAAAAEGSADARVYLFAAELAYAPWSRGTAPFWVAIGGGTGVALLALEGRPGPGYVGKKDEVAAAVPFLDVVVARDLGASFSLEATLLAGCSVPRPTVRFDGRDVAAWGRLITAATLSLAFSLPVGRDVTSNR
jgi:hypothetical protein